MSIARLQARRLFASALPWVLAALSLAWLAWRFLLAMDQFLQAQDKLAALPDAPGFTDLVTVPLLAQVAELGIVLAPLIGMSMLAGERRAGTLPLLFAAGIAPWRIVVGKFLVAWGWLLALLLVVVSMPLLAAWGVAPDWGKLAAAVLGVALFLGVLAAIALAASACVSHPALAAAIALAVSVGLWALNAGVRANGVTGGLLNYLAASSHLQALLKGWIGSVDVAYFVLLTALALALASQRLGADRVRC
ncbi:MAG TPA: ABC transporter permease subunit [Rhodanobacteraceae bacterium]|nr:ABC transporter permease subunit [Rhodanobacteraceae bacterium]